MNDYQVAINATVVYDMDARTKLRFCGL